MGKWYLGRCGSDSRTSAPCGNTIGDGVSRLVEEALDGKWLNRSIIGSVSVLSGNNWRRDEDEDEEEDDEEEEEEEGEEGEDGRWSNGEIDSLGES